MVLQKILHQYKKNCFPLSWARFRPSSFPKLAFCLPLYFFFFPQSSMGWTMRISEVREGLTCCCISWLVIGCQVWTNVYPICWVICSSWLMELIIPLARGPCGGLNGSNRGIASWFQKYWLLSRTSTLHCGMGFIGGFPPWWMGEFTPCGVRLQWDWLFARI